MRRFVSQGAGVLVVGEKEWGIDPANNGTKLNPYLKGLLTYFLKKQKDI